ncbi:MAG: hypothetical protein RLN88_13085 [Ekhidna sp.]|uniref:hypothetical protein n=1 Tax=Ekhidna sp. TaxID=2608089 RepID=UPI0032EF0594
MIKKTALWILVGFLSACTSSDKESSGSDESSTFTFEKKVTGVFIPDDIQSNLAGKRRGKLSKLYADGPSWFSFQVPYPFEKLQITFAGQEFSWTVNESKEPGQSQSGLQLQNLTVSDGNILIDIIVLQDNIQFFFSKGAESFIFKTDAQLPNSRIEVSLDGEPHDLPGILYDIGV